MFSLEVRRKYDASLILGAARPWRPTVWKRVAASLDAVFAAKTAVRTNQKLGRLGWADAAKWTGAKGFQHGDFWSPSWTAFERTGRPPDAFLHVVDPRVFGEKPTDGIASYVLFAVAVDAAVHEAAQATLSSFVKALEPVQRFTARRAWARASGGGFEDSLQDFLPTLERNEKTGRLRLPAVWKPTR